MTQDDIVRRALDEFFNVEAVDSPVKKAGWRGCVLDRDDYSDAGLPRILWESLETVIDQNSIIVCGYFRGKPSCERLPLGWDQYSKFMHDPKRFSVEYVIHDDDCQWAIWRDLDTTTLILNDRLASSLDTALAQGSTSLEALTRNCFEGDAIGPYTHAVLGKKSDVRTSADTE